MSKRFDLRSLDRVLDGEGCPVTNARLQFVCHGSIKPIPIFADAACRTPMPNPVFADEHGVIPDVYVGDGVKFDVRVWNCHGKHIQTIFDASTQGQFYPVMASLRELRQYDGTSNIVFIETSDGQLSMYRRPQNDTIDGENLPTIIQGLDGYWVGGPMMTEYDILQYIQDVVSHL